MNEYRVALDDYQGPLDLLLYLVRRDEVDICNIPIARITEQFIRHVELLQSVDPEGCGDFLVMVATLMEIKSRMVLPTPPPEEVDEELVDPRSQLIRQLLEYKKFKDAARELEQAADQRARKFARGPVIPTPPVEGVTLEELEVWDLLEAFRRLLEQTGQTGPLHRIPVDETPISLHAEDIVDALQRAGGLQPFQDVFAGRERAELIGMFLALLELIRQRRVRALQEQPFGVIQLQLLDPTPLDGVGDLEAYYRGGLPSGVADSPLDHEKLGLDAESPQDPSNTPRLFMTETFEPERDDMTDWSPDTSSDRPPDDHDPVGDRSAPDKGT